MSNVGKGGISSYQRFLILREVIYCSLNLIAIKNLKENGKISFSYFLELTNSFPQVPNILNQHNHHSHYDPLILSSKVVENLETPIKFPGSSLINQEESFFDFIEMQNSKKSEQVLPKEVVIEPLGSLLSNHSTTPNPSNTRL